MNEILTINAPLLVEAAVVAGAVTSAVTSAQLCWGAAIGGLWLN